MENNMTLEKIIKDALDRSDTMATSTLATAISALGLVDRATIVDHAIARLMSSGMPVEEARLKVIGQWTKHVGDPAPISALIKARSMAGHAAEPDAAKLSPLTGTLPAILEDLMKEEGVESPAPAAPAKVDSIPAANAQMIDALLAIGSGGKLKSINDLIGDVSRVGAERDALKERVEELLATASAAPHASTLIPKAGSVDDLTFEVVHMRANTIDWGQAKGKSSPALDFDVPTIVWRDSTGTVVRHPLCPDVDGHYKFRPKELIPLLDAVCNRDIPWVYGHTGSGKTTKIEQLAARLGFPFIRINYDAEISRTDLLGKTDIKAEAGGTTSYFKPGILPQWVEKPCFILHDEIDFVRSEVSYALQRVLEDNGAIRLDEDGGRLLKVGPLCFQFAAANTRGQGDELGMYPGAKVQTQAFLDRFKPFIEVDYLTKEVETDLLMRRVPGLAKATASMLVKFAGEMRAGFTQGEIMQTLSPRGLVYMARFIQKFSPLTSEKEAMDQAIVNGVLSKASAQDKQKVREYADRCIVVTPK
jgi:cobaltochelatase CobS